MAPVTRGVTNGKEDGFILFPGTCKGLIPPWIPVYRISRVLKKVRTLFVDEPVIMYFSGAG
jgi:hypothetical protein